MAQITKPILKTVVGFQSLALLGRAARMLPKKVPVKPIKAGKKLIKGSVDIMVGVGLLKPTAKLVQSF